MSGSRRVLSGGDPAAEERLTRAIRQDEIVPWYQPVVDLGSGALVGFEALARWVGPDGVVVLPDLFVGLAEDVGLATELDEAILRQVCRDVAQWPGRRPDLRVGINVSGCHLDDEGWDERLHAAVRAAGVTPDLVDIELTETARPLDTQGSALGVARMRSLGYRVWFDDFGTGWSQLRDLVEVPVDGIKIDQFFVEGQGAASDAVVEALTALAARLDLDTTMEGIRTIEQATRAMALGCGLGQGFLWSPAVPAAAVSGLVADWVAVPLGG